MRVSIMAFASTLILFMACRNGASTKNTNNQSEAAVAMDDSTAIANTLHGFFTWYDAHVEKLGWTRFVDDSTGDHLTLNDAKLGEYLADLKSSGLVSDELLEHERSYFKACARKWATEDKDEVPSGLSMDRFHCAMDYIAPYPTGKVTSVVTADRAEAKLTLTGEHGEVFDFKYELKKEGGKWLLSRLGCETGVE